MHTVAADFAAILKHSVAFPVIHERKYRDRFTDNLLMRLDSQILGNGEHAHRVPRCSLRHHSLGSRQRGTHPIHVHVSASYSVRNNYKQSQGGTRSDMPTT